MTFGEKCVAKLRASYMVEDLAVAMFANGFTAEYHEEKAHDHFAKLAEAMGYTIQKIPSGEAA